MKNYVQPGDVITLTAPAGGVKSGELIVVDSIGGVCAFDADAGSQVEVAVVGVFELPKASGQINEGAAVWWDPSTGQNRVANATGNGFWPIGVAVKGAGFSDTTVRVRLNGVSMIAASSGT